MGNAEFWRYKADSMALRPKTGRRSWEAWRLNKISDITNCKLDDLPTS
jgi:hypothetical protein